MLALLAAATLAVAQPAEPPTKVHVVREGVAMHVWRGRKEPAPVCKDAAMIHASSPAEPALLLRPQDRLEMKKLIELPMAKACLLGGAATKAER